MDTRRWGIARTTEQAFMKLGKGEEEGEEEDHVAGLVAQIAHAMLEEEEDDEWSKFQQRGSWGNLSAGQELCARAWGNRSIDNSAVLPEAPSKRSESQAMELLYMELVRLKMEEVAVAQQQLSLYQKALIGARQIPCKSNYVNMDGVSSMPANIMFAEQQRCALDMSQMQLLQGQAIGGGEWVAPNRMQCQSSKQRLVSPAAYPIKNFPIRSAVPLGAPVLRESGGTGVFLPRCRTGARNLRILESKRKSEFQIPTSAQCVKGALHSKRKEHVEGSSLQYPSFSRMQEVPQDIGLPTEWTY